MLLIPMVSVALVTEGRDLDVAFLAIERLRLLKRPICLEPEQRKAHLTRRSLELAEHRAGHSLSARGRCGPHALDFADRSIPDLEHAATGRTAIEPRHDKDTRGGCHVLVPGGITPFRIETAIETLGQLLEVLTKTET